ncbi:MULTISPECIES: LysR family transcriptional regulator [unclassified Streptomyces]|uniref:LysR family transcriptional regulator n=1 Tax=unclassified Streptomyces TaxID=2593676 RepID=UPI00278BE84D|nr:MULTISPECIES: LysR family transcriptional regulator [unclassified Streptomyces]
MDTRLLTTFETVAERLSFTRAAVDLGYVQSTVTAQIKTLETELGVRLFERLGRRILLTDAGRELHAAAPELLRHVERTRDAVVTAGDPHRAQRGTLGLAAPESLCSTHLPAVLKAFQDRYPQVTVVFRPSGRQGVLDDLASGRIDVGFLLERSVEVPGIEAVEMRREPFVLVAAPSHALVGSGRVRAADLASHTVLLLDSGCAQRHLMDEELRPERTRPRTIEFTTMEPVKRSAAAGLGVALLPAATVEGELARGELVALPFTSKSAKSATPSKPSLRVFSVRNRARRTGPLVSLLLDLAAEHWGTPPH